MKKSMSSAINKFRIESIEKKAHMGIHWGRIIMCPTSISKKIRYLICEEYTCIYTI